MAFPPPLKDENENVTDKVIKSLSSSFENLDFDAVRADLDKAHRIAKVSETNKQLIIVKFKSHSVRTKIYDERKNLKNPNLRLKVSLAVFILRRMTRVDV